MNIAYKYDWGAFTPDLFEDNVVITICNHFLESVSSVDRNVQFIVGRILWIQHNIPDGLKQKVVYDVRGQKVSNNTIFDFKQKVLEGIGPLKNNVLIEFLK